MLVLVVDTSTPAVTAGLVEVTDAGNQTRAVRVTINARAHGEVLAPNIAAMFDETGVRPSDLAAVVAGVGPGPFTGLRVGLVTAAAFGDALGIPTYGVCSLDALGAAASGSGRVLVATDARRREIYWAVYEAGVRVGEPAVDRPAEVAARVGAEVQYAVGDGAHKYADVLAVPVQQEPRYPPVSALAELAADRILRRAPLERLTPLYLRRPDATVPAGRKPVLQ